MKNLLLLFAVVLGATGCCNKTFSCHWTGENPSEHGEKMLSACDGDDAEEQCLEEVPEAATCWCGAS